MPDLWLPGASHRPIPQTSSDPTIRPVGDVFHIAVTNAESLYGLFTNGVGIESTGYILKDGSVEQYRPFDVECDAQMAGNSWFEGGVRVGLCSWEAQGDCSTGWTPEQMATIQTIIGMRHREWDVPLRNCPTPNSHGFGYHRMHAAWNPNAHSCPCDSRVRQWESIIEPWMNAGAPDTGGDWFDMATQADLKEAVRGALGEASIVVDPDSKPATVWQLQRVLRELLDDEPRIRAALAANADRIKAAVDAALPTGQQTGFDRAQVVNAVEQGVKNVLKGGVGA